MTERAYVEIVYNRFDELSCGRSLFGPYYSYRQAALDAEANNKMAQAESKGKVIYAWARPVMLDYKGANRDGEGTDGKEHA